MLGKVYFRDGEVEEIVDSYCYNDGCIEISTPTAIYHYFEDDFDPYIDYIVWY